jgi:hypothetical protein
VRPYPWLALALAVVAGGCAGGRHAAALSKDLSALTPCESREISLDGGDVLLTSNADSSLASVHVRKAASESVRRDVLRDVYRTFGVIHIDTETIARTTKWGLTTWTDRCGRPITFTVPSPPAR